jgi:hypothetical protein
MSRPVSDALGALIAGMLEELEAAIRNMAKSLAGCPPRLKAGT